MRKGDIVLGRRGEMGRCAVITDTEDGWLCGTGSFFIKPSDKCDPFYLVHVFRSPSCREALNKIAGGTVMPNLSNTALSGLCLSIPPLKRQREIINEMDFLGVATQCLARIYQQKLEALDSFKKSILHEAFSGSL